MASDDRRLHDILVASDELASYLEGHDEDDFLEDRLRQRAVERLLTIIGEAAKQLPDEVRQAMPGVDWRKVCGFRDVLIHAYFGIDDDILWDVIANKLPGLEATVAAHLQQP